jgi:hypothetical protein
MADQSQSSPDDLLPCPFCGGRARFTSANGECWLSCMSCQASSCMRGNTEAAVSAWNMRAQAATAPGHTDLMVAPESIDAFMEANPLPDAQPSSWQPIETAPKDRSVIAWDDECEAAGEAYFNDEADSWWWANTAPHDSDASRPITSARLWHPMPGRPPC